jgi:hypothetical protein
MSYSNPTQAESIIHHSQWANANGQDSIIHFAFEDRNTVQVADRKWKGVRKAAFFEALRFYGYDVTRFVHVEPSTDRRKGWRSVSGYAKQTRFTGCGEPTPYLPFPMDFKQC